MKKILFAVAMLSASYNVVGYDMERARVNMAQDYATCGAYYSMCSAAIINTMLPQETQDKLMKGEMQIEDVDETASEMIRVAADMMLQSFLLSDKETTNARVVMASGEMMKELQGTFNRMPVLTDKHQKVCDMLRINPQQRLQYWIDQE